MSCPHRPATRLDTAISRALAERAEAPALYAELMALCPQERLRAAHRETRFARLGLVAHLLAQPAPEDPEAAEQQARLALALVTRLMPGRSDAALVWDLQGRAWVALASARARRLDVAGAEAALAQAAVALSLGTGDGLEVARHLEQQADLRRRQGRRIEAHRLLRRARQLYLAMGDTEAAAALGSPARPHARSLGRGSRRPQAATHGGGRPAA